jgi:YHS domain-containing protein
MSVAAVLLLSIWVGCGQKEVSSTGIGGNDGSAEQEVCPVMGMEVNRDINADYKGKLVYFCCQECVTKFNKDPEKYVKKLEEQQQAAGKQARPQHDAPAAMPHH